MSTPRKRKDRKVNNAPPKPASGTRIGKKAVNVWLPEELVHAMQAYLESFDLEPSTTSCVKAALEEYLAKRDCWPPSN